MFFIYSRTHPRIQACIAFSPTHSLMMVMLAGNTAPRGAALRIQAERCDASIDAMRVNSSSMCKDWSSGKWMCVVVIAV